MIFQPWEDRYDKVLLDWMDQDDGIVQALGVPEGWSVREWLNFSIKNRALATDTDGNPVAIVGLTHVTLPHILMAPARRGGRNVLSVARGALKVARRAGAKIMIATPRRDNEASVKLCKKLGWLELTHRSLFIGRL